MSRKILVRCTYGIEVEIPDDPDYDPHFDIEENHCPWTGRVGAAFDAAYEKASATNTCWACALNGKNEIVADREIN